MKMFMSSHISFEIGGSIDARHFEACEFEGNRTSPQRFSLDFVIEIEDPVVELEPRDFLFLYMPCSSMLVGHITFYDGSTDRHRGRVLKNWAISSVGRTSLLHSECHQFESDMCP